MSLESEIKETVRSAVLEVLRERGPASILGLREAKRSKAHRGDEPGPEGALDAIEVKGPALDPLQLLTTEEVAELIRYSTEGVRDQIHAGKLRALMTGAGWRVKRIWLEEWMVKQGAEGHGEAAPDPDEEARRTVLALREKRGR